MLTVSGENTARSESPAFLGKKTYRCSNTVLARAESRARASEDGAKHVIKSPNSTNFGATYRPGATGNIPQGCTSDYASPLVRESSTRSGTTSAIERCLKLLISRRRLRMAWKKRLQQHQTL